MPWPTPQEYNEAIQNPLLNLGDTELKKGKPQLTPLGLPRARAGNFAVVYKVTVAETDRSWAVKCFTREVQNLRERYRKISAHLKQVNLPFTVDFTYLDRGIRIRGQWYPVLKMQWVEGFTLNQFVKDHLEEPGIFETLIKIWIKLSTRLRDTQTTHADLQHGNVLLVPGKKPGALDLKLIDYDGMCVPALAGSPSGEIGHENYQHPRRLKDGIYSPEVDRFPHLVICCALRCLAVKGKPLWDEYNNDDNLLFRKKDFQAPGGSELFLELWQCSDPLAHFLVGHLILASQKPSLEDAPLLSDLLGNGHPLLLSAPEDKQVEAILSAGAVPAPPRPAAAPTPISATSTASAEKWYKAVGLGPPPAAAPTPISAPSTASAEKWYKVVAPDPPPAPGSSPPVQLPATSTAKLPPNTVPQFAHQAPVGPHGQIDEAQIQTELLAIVSQIMGGRTLLALLSWVLIPGVVYLLIIWLVPEQLVCCSCLALGIVGWALSGLLSGWMDPRAVDHFRVRFPRGSVERTLAIGVLLKLWLEDNLPGRAGETLDDLYALVVPEIGEEYGQLRKEYQALFDQAHKAYQQERVLPKRKAKRNAEIRRLEEEFKAKAKALLERME